MVKTKTLEEKNNPKRKKRLRKKLHVGEYKHNFLSFSLNYEMRNEKDEDVFYELLEEAFESLYGFIPAYLSTSYRDKTTVAYDVEYNLLNEDNYLNAVSVFENKFNEKLYDVEIDDAYYPKDED